VIERIVRVASSFEEADELDRQDVAAMSFEERISGVERLRRVWFGEDRAESRLERVLECADLPPHVLTGISGVSFDEAWQGRVEADFVRTPLYVIGREALLRNKRASARDKDLRDVALLEKHALPGATKQKRPSRRGRAKRR
jgi:hypothetical protein